MRIKTQETELKKKTCTRCGRTFGEGHLNMCPAMGKTCKSCSKQNHFAKHCRSNQVNEIAEENSSSEEERNLIHSFDSCEEFEIIAIEPRVKNPHGKIGRVLPEKKDDKVTVDTKDVKQIEIRRDPKSHKIKALKALVRIDKHITNMTIDTGSPVSFLNWTTAKQLMEGAPKIKFIPAEELNLSTQFVDYSKQPIQILRRKTRAYRYT